MAFDLHPINRINAKGAPDFVTIEAKRLLNQAIEYFEAETGRVLSPSQVEMYLLETIAYMLSVRGAEEQLAFQNCFIAFAQGEWLDRHGADRATHRLAAAHATTRLWFASEKPATARLHIPAGTRVSDQAGQAQFKTLSAVWIESGKRAAETDAQAVETGPQANDFAPGTITALVDPVPGITAVTNLIETAGGAAVEDDAHYRARLALAFERIGAGLSYERYVADVLGWSADCVDVAITRPAPGHVNIYPLMTTGAPGAGEIAALTAVFDDSNIHQGDFIQVFAPEAHDFSVTLDLTLSDPGAAEPAEQAVRDVLDIWKSRLGGYVAPSELIRAARAVPGVIEADIPGLAFAHVAKHAWRRCTGVTVNVRVI